MAHHVIALIHFWINMRNKEMKELAIGSTIYVVKLIMWSNCWTHDVINLIMN
jgi:hypothetical protein